MYRLAWPAQYLAAQGHDIGICYFGQRGILEIHSRDGVHVDGISMPPGVDVVVVQRVSNRLFVEAIKALRSMGIAVVMDMDDDLGRIHKSHVAYKLYNPKVRFGDPPPLHHHEHVQAAADAATMVTSTTPALQAQYARHGRGAILDNYVCGSDLDIPHDDSDTIGWAGDTKTRADDWQVVGDALRKMINEGNTFFVVGAEGNLGEQLKLPFEPSYTGYVHVTKFTTAMSRFGIGMAPLFPSRFNEAKSRLKPIQMAAVGMPWVGSPSYAYRRFHEESGTGILASNPQEWYQALKRLVNEPNLRVEMGAQGREYMKTQTIEANAWRWWEAWTDALKLERG